MELTVWAPRCSKVDVRIGSQDHPLRAAAGGWWHSAVDIATDHTEYAFMVDGKGPFPDPRSRWQPHGVHGASRCLDHGRYVWRDTGWRPPPFESALVYELHVGTFSAAGTFSGVIDHLDDLVGLGVTHVELMPVHEFSGERGWGYDGVALFAPHHAYGTPDDLKRLVDQCHARGLGVLLDVVYNHLGPSGNYLGQYGPYFTDRYRTPWGDAVNLDGSGSHEVRRFFCDNALMWLRDYHFDGLRLDAVHAIFDTSAVHFLEQLANEVEQLERRLGRPLTLVAESDLNDPRLVWRRERGGYQLDAQWSDDFHHALHAVLTGERQGYYADFGRLEDIAKALRQAFVYDGGFSPYRQRLHGRPPIDVAAHCFLGYLQNHDQIGNRALGERSAQLMSRGRLKIGAALVLSSPFVPMLFQGEEWAATTPFLYFTAHEDPQLAQQVRDGRRAELAHLHCAPEDIPDPQDIDTFERSRLNWPERERPEHRDILDWHRQLIDLRRNRAHLSGGGFESVDVRFDETAQWLVLRRSAVVVACNFGSQTNLVALEPKQAWTLLLASDAGIEVHDSHVRLPPESVAVLEWAHETSLTNAAHPSTSSG